MPIQKLKIKEQPPLNKKLDLKKFNDITGIRDIYQRPIGKDMAKFLYNESKIIANSIKIKKEDIITNNNFYTTKDETKILNHYIINCLNFNKEELGLIISDHELYGAGCGVIRKYKGYAKIDHLKQEFIELIQYGFENEIYPLVVYTNDHNTKYFKLFDYYYPDNFNFNNETLEQVFWFGGGQFNDFYSIPFYYQTIKDVLQVILNKVYDEQMLKNGNLISGIVYMNKSGVIKTRRNQPLNNPEDDGEPLTSIVLPSNVQVIKTQIENAGFGNIFLYEESKEPLDINYIKLSNDNYDYLLTKLENAKEELMSGALIPPERFMWVNVKEAMNSHKTMTIWNIYLNSLSSEQNKIITSLTDLFIILLDYEADIQINLPMIDELIASRQNLIIQAFQNGLITLRQAITQYNNLHNINEPINDNNPLLDERYFNYQPITDTFDGGF